jgi:uncharacterized protein (TIGR03437 family)
MLEKSLRFVVAAGAIGWGFGATLSGAVATHASTSSACTGGKPGYLVSAFRQPLSQSVLQAGIPQTVQLQIVDDCGGALTAQNGGAAQVAFDDQDASVDLQDVGGGIWEGSWVPVNATPLATLHAVVSEQLLGLGSIGAGTVVAVNPAALDAPAQISAVVNAASSAQALGQIVTPGGFITIYGTRLASNGKPIAGTTPLPTTLNDTEVFLGSRALPLIYAGPGQVNALIPQSLNPNTSYQLVIQRGSTLSAPTPLTVAEYQPGIYTLDQSGGGQGVAEVAGTTLLAGPSANGYRPVQRGSEYLTIFATGLGPVVGTNGEAALADGAAAPLGAIFQTTGTVSVTIGSASVPASFSGLTPSLVGIYQVNVLVPPAALIGNAVPLTLTVTDPATGQSVQSNSVTLAVR